MSSLFKQRTKSGESWRIQLDLSGERKSIFLGKMNQKTAETIQSRVETANSCKLAGLPYPPDVAQWLGTIGDDLHTKLSKVGLVPERKTSTLGQFIPAYIAQLDNSKDSKQNKTQTMKTLFAFFGKDKNPATITESEAKEYRTFLLTHKMNRKGGMVEYDSVKPSVVWKRLQQVNEFFKAMLEDQLIESNPFKNVKHRPDYGDERKVYIPAEDIHQVMEYTPDAEWRLIIALWRFGGLRRSSEVLRLKWEHVLWDQGKIIVPSCKTARHGKSQRIIPIFHELELPLQECWEQAKPGSVYLIEKHCPPKMKRSKDRKEGNRETNLMTTFNKIVLRAGLNPWPMPGNNMRGSLVTDLYNGKYPEIGIHTIATWIGHSPEIALKHYTRVKEDDYEKVRGKKCATDTTKNTLSCDVPTSNHSKPSVQNRVQSASVTGGIGMKTGENDISAKKQKQAVTSFVCSGLRSDSVGCRIDGQISESDDLHLWGVVF